MFISETFDLRPTSDVSSRQGATLKRRRRAARLPRPSLARRWDTALLIARGLYGTATKVFEVDVGISGK